MKASEFIKRLVELVAVEGDLLIATYDLDRDIAPILDIEIIKMRNSEKVIYIG